MDDRKSYALPLVLGLEEATVDQVRSWNMNGLEVR